MPTIRPFRALLYSPQLRTQMKDLIAPPYDVISTEGLQKLRARHEFNAVKLSLVDDPEDPARYQKMAERFRAWKRAGAFEFFNKPAFYLIEEKFSVAGVHHQRVGFVCLLETSPFSERKVLPHEHTLAGPKKDRFELLKEMGAELSQVFLCYRDPKLVVEQLYQRVAATEPIIDVPEVDHVKRRVWPIVDASDQRQIEALIETQSVLIADGHHRYETSVAFRDFDKTEKSKYVQVYLTNLEAPGFSIQPIHRLFSLPETLSFDSFRTSLAKTFRIEKSKSIDPDSLEAQRKQRRVAFFVESAAENDVWLVTRDRKSDDDAEIFSIQSEIFESILGWDVSKTSYGVLKYEHEIGEFKKTLKSLPRGVGIFLPPTDLRLVMSRAQKGERMPQKSTYFYPKIASGLINYELGNI